jgi:REP element-mobilizing transposase RayT
MAESREAGNYPRRLHHLVPAWAQAGACFHIRLRIEQAKPGSPSLIEARVAHGLLAAVRFYHERQRWHCRLFLLMPDHIHALLAFPAESHLSRVIGEWKHYASRQWDINWQANYFDHRIRNAPGLAEKYAYILRNPVVKGLCQCEEDWPWKWQSAEPLTPR